MFDCGANIGTTTVYFCKSLNNLQVYSFEPVKENYRLLKANCALNDCENAVLENKGLSSTETKYEICSWDYNSGASCIKGIRDWSDVYNGSAIVEQSDFIRLDTYVSENGINTDLIQCIWIDTEGHELEVIEGAYETISKSKALVFLEFNADVYRNKETFNKICDILMDLFDSFVVYEDCREHQNLEKCRKNVKEIMRIKDTCNILLYK